MIKISKFMKGFLSEETIKLMLFLCNDEINYLYEKHGESIFILIDYHRFLLDMDIVTLVNIFIQFEFDEIKLGINA